MKADLFYFLQPGQGNYRRFAQIRQKVILSDPLILASIIICAKCFITFFDDFKSDQNETSTCKNDCHKSHRMVANPRYHTEPVPYSMSQYANEDFLRNRKPKKMIEFSCLKLSFIITLSTAIGFGTAALIFYITVSPCSIDKSSEPNTLEMTVSPTLQPEYDFSWGTQPLTTQEPFTMAHKSEQHQIELSFQRASDFSLRSEPMRAKEFRLDPISEKNQNESSKKISVISSCEIAIITSEDLCRRNGNQIETGWRNNSMKEIFYSYATEQDIFKNAQLLKDKRLVNSSAAFYNGYIHDGFYITDSRIRRKRPCSLFENEFVISSHSCSRTGIKKNSPSV